MKYFSCFSGIGGFELGIQRACDNQCANAQSKQAKPDKGVPLRVGETLSEMSRRFGWERNNKQGWGSVLPEFNERLRATCVGYSEIDKYASSVYQRHFGGHKPYGDITTIDTADIPNFDILVGGFPCQAFSIAGKRGGFEDTRGTLFFELARILADKKPGYFCFENVKGLLSHDKGRTFKTIITTLDELGYDLQWQVLNSKHFGVPQNRERIFIVGNLRDRPRPQVFPIGEDGGLFDEECTVANAITSTEYKGPSKQRMNIVIEGVLDGEQYKNQELHRRIYNPEGIATGARIRRLTPLECERLQAFPDHWTQYGKDGEPISDTQRYKMCGNAVTVNVIKAIFVRLFDIQEAYERQKS